MMDRHFYDGLELLIRQIRQLLDSLPFLSNSEASEIRSYLDVDEYELALETAYHIILEGGQRISPVSYRMFCQLSDKMQLDSIDLDALSAKVLEEPT
jgi:hypothetical protein